MASDSSDDDFDTCHLYKNHRTRRIQRPFNDLSDDDDTARSNVSIPNSIGRKSERIKRRQSREFKTPSKKELWDTIRSSKSPVKRVSLLTPKKRVNNLTRETHRYNADILDTGEDDFSDFIVGDDEIDDEEDEDSDDDDDDDSERDNQVKTPKRRIDRNRTLSENSASKHHRIRTISSSDSEPEPTKIVKVDSEPTNIIKVDSVFENKTSKTQPCNELMINSEQETAQHSNVDSKNVMNSKSKSGQVTTILPQEETTLSETTISEDEKDQNDDSNDVLKMTFQSKRKNKVCDSSDENDTLDHRLIGEEEEEEKEEDNNGFLNVSHSKRRTILDSSDSDSNTESDSDNQTATGRVQRQIQHRQDLFQEFKNSRKKSV